MTMEFVEDLQWVIDTINKNKNTKVIENGLILEFLGIRPE